MVASDYNKSCGAVTPVADAHDMDQRGLSEQSMQLGKRLIVAGCVVAIAGILLYCYFSFSAAFEVPAAARESLVLVAAGVLLWLWGAIKYFLGAVGSDDPGELF